MHAFLGERRLVVCAEGVDACNSSTVYSRRIRKMTGQSSDINKVVKIRRPR
jgi:hypothetical protein